jgi:hypothetical protein
VEPADAAALLIAMVEGYASLAKNAQDPRVIKAGIRNIVGWLRSLRAPGNRKQVDRVGVSRSGLALVRTNRVVASDSQHRDRAKRFKPS